MKKQYSLLLILLGLTLTPVLAQDTNVCMQDLSIFAEFAKVKNYKSAYEPWMRVRKQCPTINVAVYSYEKESLKI